VPEGTRAERRLSWARTLGRYVGIFRGLLAASGIAQELDGP
jgi:hypothetical protein